MGEDFGFLVTDWGKVSDAEKPVRVRAYCKHLGLDPATEPLQLINFQGKLRLYATKSCTDQLRKIHSVSAEVYKTEVVNDCYFVYVKATDSSGRTDMDLGATVIGNLKGEAFCNASMKAVTKAKRRVTLSICGLSILDESELDTMPGAQKVDVSYGKDKQDQDYRTKLNAALSKAKTPEHLAQITTFMHKNMPSLSEEDKEWSDQVFATKRESIVSEDGKYPAI